MQMVLITGSRQATPEMLACAQRAVQWCQQKGYRVVVGDAPGVDEAVRLECEALQLAPRVWGAYFTIRQPHINPDREERATIEGGYLTRDRVMVACCTRCIAIWNGVSRGTKYTADYAAKQGVSVLWKVFE